MGTLFLFTVSPWELIARGTLMYWFLFLMFRFFLRRESGSVGLADILMIVLIADAAQNGMSGEYKSIGEGMLLVATIGFWNFLIDWLSFRYRWFERFAEPPVLLLIQRGRVIGANLQRELITEDELRSMLRQQGIDSVKDVKRASLEPDGHLSVARYDNQEPSQQKGRTPGAG